MKRRENLLKITGMKFEFQNFKSLFTSVRFKIVDRKIFRGPTKKKDRKIEKALLGSIYYIYTMYKNPGWPTASLPPAADAHCQVSFLVDNRL